MNQVCREKHNVFVKSSTQKRINSLKLSKTNISPTRTLLKMISLFPKVGYVSSLEDKQNDGDSPFLVMFQRGRCLEISNS